MEIVALSILIVIVYFIMMYIFGRTNKNTPKFTLESFISILKINRQLNQEIYSEYDKSDVEEVEEKSDEPKNKSGKKKPLKNKKNKGIELEWPIWKMES